MHSAHRLFHAVAAVVAVTAGLHAAPARAALGEPVATVAADSARLKASLRAVSPAAGYTTHELQTDAGTTVREYVTPGGVVFAVGWRGPFKPDLQALLGRYFDAYANGPRSATSTRNHVAVDTADLVVRTGGHMRAFTGLAYLPTLLPAGVAPGDLQ